MASIDFHLQDSVFHQLIQKKKFEGWKQNWDVFLRDIKPFWVYSISEHVLRSKGIILDEITERLLKIKNKNINLFGNINVNDKFVSINSKIDDRVNVVKQILPDDFEEYLKTDTESISNVIIL